MKYLAETAQDVYEIFRNGVNALFPQIDLPLSMMNDKLTVEVVANFGEEESQYFEKVSFRTVNEPELRGIILHETDRTLQPGRVYSVEKFFVQLLNMRKKYKKVTVKIGREFDI